MSKSSAAAHSETDGDEDDEKHLRSNPDNDGNGMQLRAAHGIGSGEDALENGMNNPGRQLGWKAALAADAQSEKHSRSNNLLTRTRSLEITSTKSALAGWDDNRCIWNWEATWP